MTKLSIERLFSAPDLNGAVPSGVKFAPDGTRVAWLQAAEDDPEHLNLWLYDIDSRSAKVLFDSRGMPTRTLSEEEKARRERKRITQAGIVEYFWHPQDPIVLFPIDGVLYLYHVESSELTQLTSADTFETDVRFSPDGKTLSFIREREIYILDLSTRIETRLTHDASDTVSNGLAEFIAQEEMHRFEGYWWSPDSSRIAFIQVDESPVELTQRYEIDADDFRVIAQRYPFAGKTNASVRLCVTDLTGKVAPVTLTHAVDDYLARVNWLPDSKRLAVQVQSRNQQHLDLVICNLDTGTEQVIQTETSDTWINLNDNFYALTQQDQIIWCSERSGFSHLYLLSASGGEAIALTQGEWVVARMCGVDEAAGQIYFEAFADTPLERHLYRVGLDGRDKPVRITTAGYFHQVSLDKPNRHFIDRYSAADTPVQVALCTIDGTELHRLSNNLLDEKHPIFPYMAESGCVTFGTITAADGQTLYYRLLEPVHSENSRRTPVILSVYGGPGVQRVTNEWVTPWQRYMSSRGYAIMQLDNRGSANRGKAFECPIFQQLGVAEVEDQLAAVDYLKTLPWVDPRRIAVFGHSYGGYMTLMLMMKSPGTFCCGISVAPVTDWHLYDTHYTERYLGHPNENPEGYEASAVTFHASALQDPLLMIHGMADDNVLFTHSTLLYKVLQDMNIDFQIMNYPGAKHGIAGRSTNIHRYTLMDRFFLNHMDETRVS